MRIQSFGGKNERKHRWDDNIKTDIQTFGVRVWTESSWLRIGTGGGHL